MFEKNECSLFLNIFTNNEIYNLINLQVLFSHFVAFLQNPLVSFMHGREAL